MGILIVGRLNSDMDIGIQITSIKTYYALSFLVKTSWNFSINWNIIQRENHNTMMLPTMKKVLEMWGYNVNRLGTILHLKYLNICVVSE